MRGRWRLLLSHRMLLDASLYMDHVCGSHGADMVNGRSFDFL